MEARQSLRVFFCTFALIFLACTSVSAQNATPQPLIDTPKETIKVGPIFAFDLFQRRAPEEGSALRIGGGLVVLFSPDPKYPSIETSGVIVRGEDRFASQNVLSEIAFKLRTGLYYRPFELEYFGLRMGVQYAAINAQYSKAIGNASETLRPRFWAPYAGLGFEITPTGGFGVLEQLTASYESFYKSWVFQLNIGILLH